VKPLRDVPSLREARQRAGFLCLIAALAAGCRGGAPITSAGPPTASVTPSPTMSVAPVATRPEPTISTTTIDGLVATQIPLGRGAAPIDVAFAFDALWTANHHQNSVTRLDLTTLAEVANVPVATGPGWFVATHDAIWVNSQLGQGLARIDPATNTADIRAGSWPTCGAPIAFDGSLWQMACDYDRLMRIDLATNGATDLAAENFSGIARVGKSLLAVSPEGLVRVDSKTGAFAPIGGPTGFLVSADDRSLWLTNEHVIHRVGVDGSLLADVEIPGEVTVTIAGDRAWVTQFGTAVHEVDLASNRTLRTLHVPSPGVARERDGVLWVTSFYGDAIWRIEL
jgi:streptogramin lyase